MNICIIGLGRMGHAIARRCINAGHMVFGFDLNSDAVQQAAAIGVQIIEKPISAAKEVDVYWLMLPAGPIIDQTIHMFEGTLKPNTILIDGGNSFYKDSIRRAAYLKVSNIPFLDCGTSGGLLGEKIGFSLMIGGDEKAYHRAMPIWDAVAMKNGHAHIGPSGTGHYVKTIHNGIEYALLQAYAEGFHIIKDGHFKNEHIDLAKLSEVWMHGAIIRSYILELTHQIFQADQNFTNISGEIGENGTGLWAAQEAADQGIPSPMLNQALKQRAESRITGGDYATKIVAELRHAFGGHPIKGLKNENL